MSRISRQQIYDEIKHDIITCALAPGEPLSDNQFVDRFQVSKTPIREALTSLVQDGLLEYIPNRGFMVTGISIKDIQEIFEARQVCETALFRLALKYVTDADVDRLEKLSQTNTETVEAFLKANFEFHMALAALSRNSRLVRYYENLLGESQRLFFMDFSRHETLSQWGHGHGMILSALRNRDEQAGLAAIEETLESARKRTLGL